MLRKGYSLVTASRRLWSSAEKSQLRPARSQAGDHVLQSCGQQAFALVGGRAPRIAGGAGLLERPGKLEPVEAHAARLQRQHDRGLALVGMAALGHVEQPVGGSA